MNIINKLLEKKFVIALFKKEVLPQYGEFSDIKNIAITLIKDHIWTTTYHVVIEFKTTFIDKKNQSKTLSLYCSAHSDEPRLNSYEASSYLWQNGFNQDNLTMPRPLFYSADFNGFFYQGVSGHNLYQYIHQKNLPVVEAITQKAAAWFAKLHLLPTRGVKNFNLINSRVETIIPGMNNTLDKIQYLYPRYHEACQQIYQIINGQEKQFLNATTKRWLIHGDAHPENIINIGNNKIGVIDFTDVCLADHARDLGTFLQQLEFMTQRKIGDPAYTEKIKVIFLENYLKFTKIKLDSGLRQRIDNYYNWTALRTAIFFLLKDKAEPERAHGLLVKICQDLKLNIHI